MILVADDEKNNRIIIGKLLSQLGFDHQFAENGNQVIDLVSKNLYSLVILDIQMPEKNGFDCAREIKALPKPYCNTPLVALTAGIEFPKDKAENNQLFVHYFEKPIHFQQFKNLINAIVLEKKAYEHEPKKPIQKSNVKLNFNYLLEFSFGDNHFVFEMIESIKTDLPQYFCQLSQAINDNNIAEIKAIAHKFNSPLAWIGLKNHPIINNLETSDLLKLTNEELKHQQLLVSILIEDIIIQLNQHKF